MKKSKTYLFLLLFCLGSLSIKSQQYALDSLGTLPAVVPESSGLLYAAGRLITHNDSGDTPTLYELDTLDGTVLRTVFVANASNVDWEDITADDDFIYVGDVGNNFGTRTDLTIYKIAWEDYLATDTVVAEEIAFAYADQVDFTANQFNTPYDAEALVALHDSLFLFTKDWAAARTKVYALPKVAGAYVVPAVDSFAVTGFLTGVDVDPVGARLIFSAYNGQGAYVFTLQGFINTKFSTGILEAWPLPLSGSFKTEGICWRNDRYAYLTTEGSGELMPTLYRLDTDFADVLEVVAPTPAVMIFPNPANDQLRVAAQKLLQVVMYDTNGTLVRRTSNPILEVGDLAAGSYYLKIILESGTLVRRVVIGGA